MILNCIVRFFLGLIVGIVIGGAALWFYQGNSHNARPQTSAGKVDQGAKSTGGTIQDKLRSWHLTGDDIKNDLAKTGRVIREKSQQAGHAISDATADARITTAIKAKLVRDSDLSAWHISVSTANGIVTMSGTVSSPDDIGKAMLLAMETDGVKQVISTLQVTGK